MTQYTSTGIIELLCQYAEGAKSILSDEDLAIYLPKINELLESGGVEEKITEIKRGSLLHGTAELLAHNLSLESINAFMRQWSRAFSLAAIDTYAEFAGKQMAAHELPALDLQAPLGFKDLEIDGETNQIFNEAVTAKHFEKLSAILENLYEQHSQIFKTGFDPNDVEPVFDPDVVAAANTPTGSHGLKLTDAPWPDAASQIRPEVDSTLGIDVPPDAQDQEDNIPADDGDAPYDDGLPTIPLDDPAP